MFQVISKPFTLTQKFVDTIGMYRLVSASLGVLAAFSIVFGFAGLLAYSGVSQILSLTLALLTAILLNGAIAFLLRIPANQESAVITALLLFFLTLPEESLLASWPIVAAVTLGIVSKYVLAYKKQHFLNPAAFGAAAISVAGLYTYSWWVANPVLFIPLVVLGVLVVMKVRRWVPVLTFVVVSFVIYFAEAMSYGGAVVESIRTFFFSWPTLFLAFFMLTEPFTLPSQKGPQALYAGLVGFLSNSSMFSSVISFTPELALVVANVAMLPFRLRQKLYLHLEEKKQVAKDTYEFTFKKPKGFSFTAGQYLEWMLPHKNSDSHGVRRYFTIASSPTESQVKVAMKIFEKGSSYKQALQSLDVGQAVIGSQLAGDFVLPKDVSTKLGFIAGGIGITPFRSHLRYMIDSDKAYDSVLYYCNNIVAEIAFGDLFAEAVKTLPFALVNVVAKETVSAPHESGYVTAELLKRRTPDYLERTWYLSGPPGMVNAYSKLLGDMGVKRKRIVKDFFPGAV